MLNANWQPVDYGSALTQSIKDALGAFYLPQQIQTELALQQTEVPLNLAKVQYDLANAGMMNLKLNNPGLLGSDVSKDLTIAHGLINNPYTQQALQPSVSNILSGSSGSDQLSGNAISQPSPQMPSHIPMSILPETPQQIAKLKQLFPQQNMAAPVSGGSSINPQAQATQAIPANGLWQGSAAVPASPLSAAIQQNINSKVALSQNRAQLYAQQAKQYNWVHTPKDIQEADLSQVKAMGYSTQDAYNGLSNGMSVEQMAAAKGFNDPNNYPSPDRVPTTATISKLQNRNQAVSELDVINKKVTDGIAPYSRTILGVSLPYLYDSATNQNIDQRAQYLAARALLPEIAALRLRAMSGNVGITAIQEVLSQSMANFRETSGLTISPDVYKRANQYIDQWISQGNSVANEVAQNGGNYGGIQSASPATRQKLGFESSPASSSAISAPISSVGNMVRVNLNGRTGMIPKDKLSQFQKDYPSSQVIG